MSTPVLRKAVIEIEKLRVEFKMPNGKKRVAVDELDLEIQTGEVVGLIGPNGAGKTTLIKVLMGFLRPTQGVARLFDCPPGSSAALKRIGYLPEVALYYPFLTAREALRMYAILSDIPTGQRERALDDLVRLVGLVGRDKEPLRNFSKGMLQRLGIAQALLGAPQLLILDEVTSGLDPVARYDVREILLRYKSEGKTVFFSSHELTEVALLCDRVILIDQGKILEQHSLSDLEEKARRYTALVRFRNSLPSFDRGVSVHPTQDGIFRLKVQNREVLEEALAAVRNADGEVIDVREETGSLEDYFVQVVGHRIT